MKKIGAVCLLLLAAIATLTLYYSSRHSGLKQYTADALYGVTCETLGEQHDTVITACHDAEIAYFRRSGKFHDNLGLPQEDVLPYAILMAHFMQLNGIAKSDVLHKSSTTPLLSSAFYYEISALCAANPSWLAIDALRQAAINLDLMRG